MAHVETCQDEKIKQQRSALNCSTAKWTNIFRPTQHKLISELGSFVRVEVVNNKPNDNLFNPFETRKTNSGEPK